MNLNPDCVRAVLLDLEERLKPNDMISVQTYVHSFKLLPHTTCNDVEYAIDKLYEAGFLKLTDYGSMDNVSPCLSAFIQSITYEGHKFLDTIRDDTTWGKIKISLAKAGIFTLQTIVQTAASTAITTVMSGLM